jgi:transcriptional regulator of acetoin/glycerol metabolism
VRELENVIERAVILSADGEFLEVEAELLPELQGKSAGAGERTSSGLKSVEKDHILATLTTTNWVIDGARGAAKLLDLHPNTLRSRMKKLGIERPEEAPVRHEAS